MRTMMAGTKTRSRSGCPTCEAEDRALVQYLVVDQTSQYRGNRVTSRFYPDQYARVLYAKWLTQRYRPAVGA